MDNLEPLDKKILMYLQQGLEFVPRPYLRLAEQVGGVTEAQVMERIAKMQQTGQIRRLAGFFVSQKLGYVTTLCAAQVDREQLPAVAQKVSALPGVTHNYARDHQYNMWFTLHASSLEEQKKLLAFLQKLPGIKKLANFDVKKIFKLKVIFKV